MKWYCLILFNVLLLANNCLAQEDFIPGQNSVQLSAQDPQYNKGPWRKGVRPRYVMSTSVSAMGNGSNIFTNSVNPEISFPFTNKIRISAGTSLSFSKLNNIYLSNNESSRVDATLLQNTYYVAGDYFLSPKLTLSGLMLYEQNRLQSPQINPKASNFSGKEMRIGFEYKVNENIRISGEFGFSDRLNSYRRSPFSSGLFDHSQDFYW